VAHRHAVLHVLSGSERDRAHARTALAACTTTRAVSTEARHPAGKSGDVAEIGRLTSLAVSSGARLLHCHGAGGAWHAWKAAMAVGARFGTSVQGRDVLVEATEDARLRGALVWARLVVVPSQFLADAVLARDVPHERVHVVPPGVPLGPEPAPRRNNTPVLVFTGAFDAQSGVLDVAQAVKGQPVHARFVGSGPLEAELRSHGVEVTVTDDPEVERQARYAADLAMTAGRSTDEGDAEPWGRSAVEAQAAGLPVIATRNGGLAQWVDPDGAMLVPSHGDVVHSLRAALEDLLARPGDWEAMGRSGRAHVREHLDVERRTAELETLWAELRRSGPLAKLGGALTRPPDQF
jgi:glycosyltransferase involved in cell wall biosynthesis